MTDSNELKEPESHSYEAAVAFVDISGFTKLSKSLSDEYGADGAEELNRYVSGYFEQLIAAIQEHGGDIIKFAGDAMLVVWRVSEFNEYDEVATSSMESLSRRSASKMNSLMFGVVEVESLSTLVLRAVSCMLYLHKRFNNQSMREDVVLRLHAGVGCGVLKSVFCGGVDGV